MIGADDVITTLIDWINWNPVMQVAVVFGVLITVFRMQTAEQLERIVGCNSHHGAWGNLRRLSNCLIAFALLWCLMYGYERGWQPWPPMAVFVLMYDFASLVSVAIMRQDIGEHVSGNRQVIWFSRARSTEGRRPSSQ